jgi:Domain of unknown function (DUF4112)
MSSRPRRLRALSPGMQARIDLLRRWSTRLDSAFEIPGLRVRFGWDPLLGLLPGLGDLITPLYSIAVLLTAAQLGVPRVVQLRMLLNVIVDAVVGAVPLAGDAFDIAWKANDWNMRLLERHAWEERPPAWADWLFVGAVALAMLAVVVAPIVVLWLLVGWVRRWDV